MFFIIESVDQSETEGVLTQLLHNNFNWNLSNMFYSARVNILQ